MPRIVVVGSVAWDEVVRLREALRPGCHLEAATAPAVRMGGGAANTGVPLAHAGHQVILLGAVGDDADGDRLLEALRAEGVDVGGLRRQPGPSTRSLVLVDPDGERTVVNLDRCEDVPPADSLATEADALYVRSRSTALAPMLSAACRHGLVMAHVPPHGPGLRPAHVLVGSASDLPARAASDPWAFARETAGEPLRWLVVTRGAAGASAWSEQQQLDVPAPRISARDTTGAGDAFAAGLVHALVGGAAMPAALEAAVRWGAEAAASEGSVLSHAQVRHLLADPAGR